MSISHSSGLDGGGGALQVSRSSGAESAPRREHDVRRAVAPAVLEAIEETAIFEP